MPPGFEIRNAPERVVFTPRTFSFHEKDTILHPSQYRSGSVSAPSNLVGGSGYSRSEFIQSGSVGVDESPMGSLWDVIRSQQRQISDLQRKVLELSSTMGDLQVTVADRVCTPSICDPEEYRTGSKQNTSSQNYKSMRSDYIRFAGSFLSEWESLRKSKILALPGPSSCVEEISDEESSCATTPRASDEYSIRVQTLIQKYTT